MTDAAPLLTCSSLTATNGVTAASDKDPYPSATPDAVVRVTEAAALGTPTIAYDVPAGKVIFVVAGKWAPKDGKEFTADIVAERYKLSREYQDEYSLESQRRMAAAQQANDARHGRVYGGLSHYVPTYGATGDPEIYFDMTPRRVHFLTRTGAKLQGHIWGAGRGGDGEPPAGSLARSTAVMAAGTLLSRVTGFPVHDLGCTLKAIRRACAAASAGVDTSAGDLGRRVGVEGQPGRDGREEQSDPGPPGPAAAPQEVLARGSGLTALSTTALREAVSAGRSWPSSREMKWRRTPWTWVGAASVRRRRPSSAPCPAPARRWPRSSPAAASAIVRISRSMRAITDGDVERRSISSHASGGMEFTESPPPSRHTDNVVRGHRGSASPAMRSVSPIAASA